MKELTVFNHDGMDVIDSREVAEMVGKSHGHLLRDISGYIKIMQKSTQSNFGFSDFFIFSEYKDSTGRVLPCYLLTKKGCDMVANKMTGEKGVLFTAAYVDAFERMRKHNQIDMSKVSPELQTIRMMVDNMINVELEQKRQAQQLEAVNKRVDNIRDVVSVTPMKDTWRDECRRLIIKIAQSKGGNEAYKEINGKIFDLVNKRAGVSLDIRLTNRRKRMAEEGICKSTRDKLNKIDIIAEDKKLIEIYTAIVKEMAVKCGVV